ncbi:MAG: hypothetical protein ACREAK_10500, partial [Nitrosarchaeum sp.]
MSFTPAVLGSLFSTLGKVAHSGIQQLINSQIIVHKGVTFYHRESEFEFAFLLSLGDESSLGNNFLNKIASITKKPIEFENVIEIKGHGMTKNENLVNLGIITMKEGKGEIDFGKLIREVKSSIVFIKVRVKAPEDFKHLLVSSRIDKTSRHYEKEKIETNIEIALDYANLWKKVFDQFTVRDIEFPFHLEVSPETIVEQIPQKTRDRIISAGEKIGKGEKDAVSFLSVMSECFLSFEREDKRIQLKDLISVSPEDKFYIKEIYPTMNSMVIARVGHPIVLP